VRHVHDGSRTTYSGPSQVLLRGNTTGPAGTLAGIGPSPAPAEAGRRSEKARFLFGPEVHSYLREVRSHLVNLITVGRGLHDMDGAPVFARLLAQHLSEAIDGLLGDPALDLVVIDPGLGRRC
jgi:hypothetical protein